MHMENSRKTMDLGGSWEIAFDPDSEGLHLGWTNGGWPVQSSQPIQTPAIWNIEYPQADGIGFYRTTFSVPDAWRGKPVLLHFEGVMYRCEVWIDGQFVGSHEGGYTPFWFDVTSYLHSKDQNELILRVVALSKKKPVDGMLLHQTPLSKQNWYYPYGGIWGRVYLESCPMVICQNVIVDPDLRGEKARLEITLNNRREQPRQMSLKIKVVDPRGAVVIEQDGTIPAPPGVAHFTYVLPLPRPLAWSCDHPDLYSVEISVRDEDGEEDHQLAKFGMRDFTVQDGEFFLNGEPTFIRGVLLQPNYPVNLIIPPDREMMVREITLAKEAGFNLIRTHIRPAPPGYLDLTDQMGMLVYAESCLAWIRESPRIWDHGRREVKAMIDRDRNHPSVVIWGIYNENPPASALNSEELVRLARSIDPTRVIVDNSGGSLAIDQDFGWIDRATVTPNREVKPERILDIHLYLGAPISASIYDWLRKLGSGAASNVLVDEGIGSLPVVEEFDRESRSYRGKIFVSEIGYGGMSDLEETVSQFNGREDLLDATELKTYRDSLRKGYQKRKLDRVFGSLSNLFREAQEVQAAGNTLQFEALLINPRISGYGITQLNDVSFEFHAGLLDLWRNPKPAYYAAQRLNLPQVLVLNARPVTVEVGGTATVDLTLVNRAPMEDIGCIFIAVKDPQGEQVYSSELELNLRNRIQPLESLPVEIRIPGNYEISARLEGRDKIMAVSTETILGLEQVEWSGLPDVFTLYGQIPDSGNANSIFQGGSANPNIDKKFDLSIGVAACPATVSEDEWDALFKSVDSGGWAIIGALRPEDKTVIQEFNKRGFELELHPGVGSWMGCYHWTSVSDIFTGLPAGGLAKRPYAEIFPKYVLSELGGDTLAGSLRNTEFRQEKRAMLWYSDIERVRYGEGHILFCQYRVFELLDQDPMASHLAYNVLRYATQNLKAGLPEI
jgi:beta-galactosidase